MNATRANAKTLLLEGIAAAKAGDFGRARGILSEVVGTDPRSEIAWHWLSHVAASPEQAISCLKHVLALNPSSERALRDLTTLEARRSEHEATIACPFCRAQIPRSARQCGRCGVLFTLADPAVLLRHTSADRALLQAAVERHQLSLGRGKDASVHQILAIAHLNLHDLPRALGHLEALCRLRSDSAFLRRALDRARALEDADPPTLRQLPPPIAERSAPRAPGRTPIRVVLIDDSLTVQKLVRLTLERQGFELHCALEGLEGQELVAELLPDLVLLDVRLPGIDGCEVCCALKARPETADIPVVMLSGRDRVADKARALRAGAAAYITKPFDPSHLTHVLRNVTLDRKPERES